MSDTEANAGSLRYGERAWSYYYQTEDIPRNVSCVGVPTRPADLLQNGSSRSAVAETFE